MYSAPQNYFWPQLTTLGCDQRFLKIGSDCVMTSRILPTIIWGNPAMTFFLFHLNQWNVTVFSPQARCRWKSSPFPLISQPMTLRPSWNKWRAGWTRSTTLELLCDQDALEPRSRWWGKTLTNVESGKPNDVIQVDMRGNSTWWWTPSRIHDRVYGGYFLILKLILYLH